MVSTASGIAHGLIPLCLNGKPPPPVKEGLKLAFSMINYLAQPLHWKIHCPRRPAAQRSQEEWAGSKPCEIVLPYCGGVLQAVFFLTFYCIKGLFLRIIGRHLIVEKGVQPVLPATQETQVSNVIIPFCPPQTTSLPPDRRERLWLVLVWGRSGMEQVSEGGRGNNSTFDKRFVPS